jgi:hypothetical protein
MARAARRVVLCSALGALSLACAPAAHAASARFDYTTGTFTYKAAAGETNRLTVSYDALLSQYTVTDSGAKSMALTSVGRLGACALSLGTIRCSAVGIRAVKVDLADLEDRLQFSGDRALTVEGGAGPDRIETGAGADTIYGEGGADEVRSGGGNDVVDGGAGSDRIEAGAGDDSISSTDGVADEIRCDDGADAVTADRLDDVESDCEKVASEPEPPAEETDHKDPSGTGPDSPDGSGGSDDPATGGDGRTDEPAPLPPAPDIVLPVRPVSLAEPGVLDVKVGCAEDANAVCQGDIYIDVPARYFVRKRHGVRAARGQHVRRQRRRIGHRRFRIEAGEVVNKRVRIAFRGQHVLRNRRIRRLRGRVVVLQRNAAGKVLGRTTRPVILERKWARRGARGRRR